MRAGMHCRHDWRVGFIRSTPVFGLSRLWLFGVEVFVQVFTHGIRTPSGSLHFNQPWLILLNHVVYTADSGWYMSIVTGGYTHQPFSTRVQANWAFFPGYPAIVRFLGNVFGHHYLVVGVIISNLSFWGFMVCLWVWVARRQGGHRADFAIFLAAMWPTSPYTMAFRADSLFMLTVILFWVFLDGERFSLAAVLGLLASLIRPTGVLLAVPYLVAVWQHRPRWAERFTLGMRAGTFGTGLITTAAIDQHCTGNLLAFSAIQQAWGRHLTWPFHWVIRWMSHPTITDQYGWDLGVMSVCVIFLGLVVTLALYRNRRRWPDTTYVGIITLTTVMWTTMLGTVRFMAQIPQVYVTVADWAGGSNYRRDLVLIGITMLGTFYAVLWALGISAVMS